MSNHDHPCPYCGVDMRSYSCKDGCPREAYEKAKDTHRRACKAFMEASTEDLRERIKEAEQAAKDLYYQRNPPPTEPLPLWKTKGPKF